MKTTNNVQKAITKSLAVIISLVLITITVNAQEFWKNVLTNNGFSQIAYAMAETETTEAANEANNASLEAVYLTALTMPEEEAELEMEDWMTESDNFFHSMTVVEESENDLELEGWMTNESYFNGMDAALEVESEDALELDEWMTNDANFKIRRILVIDENDPALRLENWMVNSNVWKI